MMRTPQQNLNGVMTYLKIIEPQREAFEKITRYNFVLLTARLDYLEGHVNELEVRLDELL